MPLSIMWLSQAGGAADLPSAWGIVQTGGIAGILFLGLYLVFSGRIPTKQQLTQLNTQLDEMTADRDFWRGLALKGTNLVEGHVRASEEEMTARLTVIENLLKAKESDGT